MNQEEYIKNNFNLKTKQELANDLNMTYNQIDHLCRKYNLKHYKHNKWTADEINILKEYYPTETVEQLLERLPNRSYTSIEKKVTNLKIKKQCSYTYINVQGYLTDCHDRNNKVAIHRKLYEEYHNVKLTSNDIIHHKDGNKLNNSINNLELLTRSEHINRHRDLLNNSKR